MIGPYIVFIVLAVALILVGIAAASPKLRNWKFQSPIKRVESKKKTVRRKTKKNKQVWIRIW